MTKFNKSFNKNLNMLFSFELFKFSENRYFFESLSDYISLD